MVEKLADFKHDSTNTDNPERFGRPKKMEDTRKHNNNNHIMKLPRDS